MHGRTSAPSPAAGMIVSAKATTASTTASVTELAIISAQPTAKTIVFGLLQAPITDAMVSAATRTVSAPRSTATVEFADIKMTMITTIAI